jgi:signal peptidase I
MRWLKFAAGLISLTIVTVLAGLALVATVLPLVLESERVVLTSGSMMPLIDPGDIVITSPVQHPVDPGTVVVFENPNKPGSLVTHRVLEVLPDGSYRTKGDANHQPDVSPVTPGLVRGRGTFLVPAIGVPAVWLQQGHPEWAAAAGALVLVLAWLSRYGLLNKHDPWLDPQARDTKSATPRRSRRQTTAAATLVLAVGLTGAGTCAMPQPAEAAFAASFQNARNTMAVSAPAVSLYLKTSSTVPPPTNLSLANTVPTATTLANYDARDTVGGLNIAKEGTQRWLSSAPVALTGPVRLTVWSAMAGFNTTQAGSISLSLWDCNIGATTCTQLGTTVTSASSGSWSGGSSTWVAKEFNLGTINRQTTRLQLRLTVNSTAGAAMMFAYDTTAYPARITSG